MPQFVSTTMALSMVMMTLAVFSETADAFSVGGRVATRTQMPTRLFMVEDDRDHEKVPVRRKGGRRYLDDDEDEYYDVLDRDRFSKEDEDEEEWDDDDDDDDDEYDDDDDGDEEYGLFSNTVIDNPLLDSIDPDGSYERFSELFSDGKFWLDICIFISILNFLSWVGPRDPYANGMPWDLLPGSTNLLPSSMP